MKSIVLTVPIKDSPTTKNNLLPVRQKLTQGFLITLILWLMLWGGYNAEIGRDLISPNFLNSALSLFHGLRSLLPFLAAYLAIILLLGRRSLSIRPLQGPLGLLVLYAFFGVTSSILSKEPFTALSWAIIYGAVLIVVWAIALSPNSLRHLSLVINANWVIAAGTTVFLVVFFLLQPGVISSLTASNFFAGRPYENMFGVPAEMQIFGMVGTRPTGLGRYAAVAAIIGFANIWNSWKSKKRLKFIWFFLFLLFLLILIWSQARTAILGFLAGVFLIIWLKSRSKFLLIFGLSFALFLLGLFGFYQVFWKYLTLGKMVFDPMLSGRIATWQEGWQLFLSSPLMGFGFQADRIFLTNSMNIHNAFLLALVQTGLVGTFFFVLAFIWAWIILFRLFRQRSILKIEGSLLIEIAGVLAFITISSITETTGAFFGANWLFLAPLLAYITILNQKFIIRKNI